MAEGLFYVDSLPPHQSADVSTTLTTTDKAIATGLMPQLGAGFFNKFIGKGIRCRLFGKYTNQTSPGNLTISIYFGTGADANGTVVVASAATALQASQSNLSWVLEFVIRSRTLGSSGTLFGTGLFVPNVALILSTAQPVLLPTSSPAASGSVDLTSSNIIMPQMKYSGSATQTVVVSDCFVEALN